MGPAGSLQILAHFGRDLVPLESGVIDAGDGHNPPRGRLGTLFAYVDTVHGGRGRAPTTDTWGGTALSAAGSGLSGLCRSLAHCHSSLLRAPIVA